MADGFEGGVARAREMVDELTGDTQAFVEQIVTQLRGTVARNEKLRDGLEEQIQRLDALLDYQRGQLAATEAAAAQIPSGEVGNTGVVASDVDLSDPDLSLSDRVLAAVMVSPGRSATVDELAARMSAAGAGDLSRRQISTAVTNLVRRGDVARDDETVTVAR